jgi:peptidoglycan/LPS O-acetylase OafA/YrhL
MFGAALALAGMLFGAFASTPKLQDTLATTLGLVLLFSNERALGFAPASAFFRAFAGFSYSLYVIHTPVIVYSREACSTSG